MDYFEKLEQRQKEIGPLTPTGKARLKEILESSIMMDALALLLNDIEAANKLTSLNLDIDMVEVAGQVGSIRGRLQTLNDLYDLTYVEEKQ